MSSPHRTLDQRLVVAAAGAFALLVVAVIAQSFLARASPAAWAGTGFSLGALGLGLAGVWHHAHQRDLGLDALEQQGRMLERQRRELARHAADLARINHASTQAHRDLDQFTYLASHDLKAPLRGIASLATWVEEDLGDRADARTLEHLRLLRGRVERLDSLLEGILSYARAGRSTGHFGEVDVRAVVDGVLADLPAVRGARVVIGELPALRTYREPLALVWSNLIGNALKHGARPGGLIEIGAVGDGRGWRFWVKDDGPGIDPAYHDRVFEMFQTLQPRDTLEGAGVGLAVTRRLVEAHGGRVSVTSAPGSGATCHFTWSETT